MFSKSLNISPELPNEFKIIREPDSIDTLIKWCFIAYIWNTFEKGKYLINVSCQAIKKWSIEKQKR